MSLDITLIHANWQSIKGMGVSGVRPRFFSARAIEVGLQGGFSVYEHVELQPVNMFIGRLIKSVSHPIDFNSKQYLYKD